MLQFLVFGAIGVVNTLVDALVYLALTRWFSVPPVIANVCGFLAGSLHSYIANGLLTFRVAPHLLRSGARFTRFMTVVAVTLAFSTLCFSLAFLVMPDLAAKAVATVLTMAASFQLSRSLVFAAAGERGP